MTQERIERNESKSQRVRKRRKRGTGKEIRGYHEEKKELNR